MPIEPKAFLICLHDGKALMQKGHNKGKIFYRPLGGHIEQSEKSIDTIKREIKEEINSGLCNLRLLGVAENIFVYKGVNGHEIVFLYYGDLTRKELYEKAVLERDEDGEKTFAYWVPLRELKRVRSRVYPTGVYKIIVNEWKALNQKEKK